jgi:hypothetical protein
MCEDNTLRIEVFYFLNKSFLLNGILIEKFKDNI